MATVKKTASKSRPWQVRWRDPAGDQRKRSFAKRVQADRFRTEVEHQVQTGSYVDQAAGRQTLRERGEAWRTSQPVRHNTKVRHSASAGSTTTRCSATGRSRPSGPPRSKPG